MIVLRFKVQCQPDKIEEVMAAYEDVIPASRALEGVISFDIGRDVADSNSFIGTEVFVDQGALERQESLPETATVYGVLEKSLVGAPEATIFDVASSRPFEG